MLVWAGSILFTNAPYTGETVNTVEASSECGETAPIVCVVKTETVYTSLKAGDVLCGVITAYCSCPICCGDHADGYTADGTHAEVGDCACNWLPFGSVIRIYGDDYTVSDRGSYWWLDTIGRVDIYKNTHAEATAYGRQSTEIIIISIGE